ncbi:MAG: LytTR family DNA-binding domain-containing protein [Bacteroidota bacterium]
MNYNCLIVDDERPALKLLTAYVSKLPHLELLTTCENAMEALAALQNHTVDLLFLDIQMPELTGLDLLKVLQNKPQVILTTAYREYAVEGFALQVTDYLVKPFSLERFIQAVNKATAQIDLRKSQNSILLDQEKLQTTPAKDHFFVRTNHKMTRINFSDILYLESMREYVAIHTRKHRYVVNQTMNTMQAKLPTDLFMRVHRSYIIALAEIKTINGNLIIINDQKIPVGTSYRKRFFEQIELL